LRAALVATVTDWPSVVTYQPTRPRVHTEELRESDANIAVVQTFQQLTVTVNLIGYLLVLELSLKSPTLKFVHTSNNVEATLSNATESNVASTMSNEFFL